MELLSYEQGEGDIIRIWHVSVFGKFAEFSVYFRGKREKKKITVKISINTKCFD